MTTQLITQLNYFGELAILAQSQRLNNSLSNKKMKPQQYRGDFIQHTILPLYLVQSGEFKGKGTLEKAQSCACSSSCGFTVLNGGGCYVNHEIRTAIKSAHKIHTGLKANQSKIHIHPQHRFTVWGDVGRLNELGREYIYDLVNESTTHLAYTADFHLESMQAFKGFFMASCQTRSRVEQALYLGWKVYASTQEAIDALNDEISYKCPVDNDGLNVSFGCSTCPIKCNGRRHVKARLK